MQPLPRLDPNEEGNTHLYTLLRKINPDDVQIFVEKLTTQPLDTRFHTYRELLIGAHLCEHGLQVRYEHQIDSKTPDWSLLNIEGFPKEVIDVFTLHQRRDKDIEITTSLKQHNSYAGWITVPPEHVYRKLSDKAGQYSVLTEQYDIPFVLALFVDFKASVEQEEVRHVLFDLHGGWFKTSPHISGLVYSRIRNFQFEFRFFSNPYAMRKSALESQV